MPWYTEISAIKREVTDVIHIPYGAARIIDRLEAEGFEAYVVGGCVRDSLLCLSPHDWDICTSAPPEKILQVFSGFRVIETGLKHGSVTVLMDQAPYEVTTFRVDGPYTDQRRPDNVSFVESLREDVSRRDFTINAMAYHPQKGLFDFFGGAEDLQRKLIRCVGDPNRRFSEDALRLLRGLRFAATYEFSIEPATAKSLYDHRESLKAVAQERIRVEFVRLLTGPGAVDILNTFFSVICVFLPELQPMKGFDQKSPHHNLDLWAHTLKALFASPPQEIIRLSVLMHDLGKPDCFTQDENGIGHFYGHPEKSAQMAEAILKRLRFDNRTVQAVETLVRFHGDDIAPARHSVRKWLARMGEEALRQLLVIKRADAAAQSPAELPTKMAQLNQVEEVLAQVLSESPCLSLKDLKVNGSDLIALGIPPGPAIGRILSGLLARVMDEKLENQPEALLEEVRRMQKDQSCDW